MFGMRRATAIAVTIAFGLAIGGALLMENTDGVGDVVGLLCVVLAVHVALFTNVEGED